MPFFRCSIAAEQNNENRRISKVLVESGTIFIAFKHCVVTVPLKWCSANHCESACSGAADPFCGWNGTTCTPLPYPRKIVKSDLESRKPCPVETQIGKPNLTDRNPTKNKPEQNGINSELAVNTPSQQPTAAKVDFEKETEDESINTLMIVAVVASLCTFVVTVFCLLMWHCCRTNRKQGNDEETLQQKQSAELHHMATSDGEKRSSISRIAQTYRNYKELFTKAITPLQTPELTAKSDKRRERRENNYTEAPKLQQAQKDQERAQRRPKSRLDSTSTASSRYDSITRNTAMKPLLSTPPASEQGKGYFICIHRFIIFYHDQG